MVAPSPLVGANGLRWGPDGRLYVAQAWGNQISAVGGGVVDVVSSASGPIVSPDDIAFDSRGNLYATELMVGRVSMRAPDGSTAVLSDQVPGANGITVEQDRLYISEFRDGGRILELYPDGRQARVVTTGLAWPNAMSQGPDGKLYFPLVPAGEIWRVAPETGELERFATGLSVATAVKFAPDGTLVALSAGDGTIHRYDIDSGRHDVVARITPGMDNLEFAVDGGILVSSFVDGTVSAVSPEGKVTRIVEGALLGPFGLAAGRDGVLLVADGNSLVSIAPDGVMTTPLVTVTAAVEVPWIRGVAAEPDGSLLFTSPAGVLSRFGTDGSVETVLSGLDQPMGVAVAPDGEILVCAYGAGQLLGIRDGVARVLGAKLGAPAGVCVAPDGSVLITDASGGRLLTVDGGTATVVAQDFAEPHGVAATGDAVFVLDKAAGSLDAVERRSGVRTTVVDGLPVDRGLVGRRTVAPGLSDVPAMNGPMFPFAGLAITSDGALHMACEADGSILRVSRAS